MRRFLTCQIAAARITALETSGAPGSARLVHAAGGNSTMIVNLTSGVEVSLTMDANSTIQLSYTAGVSDLGIFYVYNQPDRTLTWPSISRDTVDGVAPPLTEGDGIMTVIGVYKRFVTLRRFLIDKNVRDDVSAGVTILRQLVASTYP